MHYNTVSIFPSGDGKWGVVFIRMIKDRVKVDNPTPNALGFFHYPCRWGKQKAFIMLRDYLVKRHDEEIAALQKSRDALLALPDPIGKEVEK